MRFRHARSFLFIPLLALAVAVAGCAGTLRTMAKAGVKTAQTADGLATKAEAAHTAGTLPTADYKNFLTAEDKLADAGTIYSKALQAYIAGSGGATQLSAALAGLIAAFESLPESVKDAVFKGVIQADTSQAAPALSSAQKASLK